MNLSQAAEALRAAGLYVHVHEAHGDQMADLMAGTRVYHSQTVGDILTGTRFTLFSRGDSWVFRLEYPAQERPYPTLEEALASALAYIADLPM